MDTTDDTSPMDDYQRRLYILLERMKSLQQSLRLAKQSFGKDDDKSVEISVEDPQLAENIDEEESEKNEGDFIEDDDDGWVTEYE